MAMSRLAAALADRYRIERELGAGGMATVYLAQDLKHDRKVAVKVLRPELAAVIGAERFLTEIRTTANLQHPDILPLFDSGTADSFLFYVMPFIEGESLRDRLNRETQLPISDAVRIATEVAGALDYAHRHNVIHRDIKPENILLHDGRALVADFGIALAASKAGGTRMTETGMSLGTPHYMSPEQAMGQREITARSDVYAIGCVMYEMLVGEPPFNGPTAQAIVAQVMTEEPRALLPRRRTIPPHVEVAVLTALEKLPADRFASAKEFAEALANTHSSAHSLGGGKTRGHGAAATPAWRPWAFLLVGLALGGGMVWRFGTSSADVAARAPRHWSITLPDSAPMVAGRNQFDVSLRSLDVSRDGRSVVYVTEGGGHTSLALVQLDAGTTVPLRGTEGAILPAFSPDGRSVAFVSGSDLRRVSLADGTITPIASGLAGAGDADDLLWQVDDRIYLAKFSSCFSSVKASGGDLTPIGLQNCHGGGIGTIGARTDWLLVASDGVMGLLSPATGERRPLFLSRERAGAPARELAGGHPRFVAPSILLFTRDSTVFAARFDPQTLRLTGDPTPVLTGVAGETTGEAHLAISSEGTAVWGPGGDGALGRFVWVGQNGRVQDSLFLGPAVVGSFALSKDGRRLAIQHLLSSGRSSLVVADLSRRVLDSIPFDGWLSPHNWIGGGEVLIAWSVAHGATVRLGSAAPVIDSSEGGFEDESSDGLSRCRGDIIYGKSVPTDSIRLGTWLPWCRFSPDNRQVAWISASDGGLFVAPTDSNGTRARVQLAPAGADEPRWSRDGKTIYYRNATRWFAVSVPLSGSPPSSPGRLLFEGHFLQAEASWDLGPDGRFLLLQGPPPIRLTRLRVITDFPRFLETKLGGVRP
jgi:eukaryotic-like serine/threonine-protein kinase